jgi:hypothetical protein
MSTNASGRLSARRSYPDREHRRADRTLTDDQQEQWMRWLQHALMPANTRMRDLILNRADLVIEDSMPEPLRAFCAHVAAYEVALSLPHRGAGERRQVLVGHPGAPYIDYVRRSFEELKREHHQLTATRRRVTGHPRSNR